MRKSKNGGTILEALRSRHVLFACEGTAEQVIIQCLCEAGELVVSPERAVRSRDGRIGTTHKKAKVIQQEFLNTDYRDGLVIARIYDTNPGSFTLDKVYVPPLGSTLVADFITSPEIEALILVRENEWRTFEARRGSDRELNASDWCKQRLGYRELKKREFLTKYWSDPNVVRKAICDYTSLLGGHKADHLRLSDLLE